MIDLYDTTGASGGSHCPCPPPKRDTLFGKPILVTDYQETCPVHNDFARFMREREAEVKATGRPLGKMGHMYYAAS